MSAPLSLTTKFKMAKQADMATPAATGFICGRMLESELFPDFQDIDPGPEHYCGSSQRSTLHKSPPRRAGYLMSFAGRQYLHPDLYGIGARLANRALRGSAEATKAPRACSDSALFTLGS